MRTIEQMIEQLGGARRIAESMGLEKSTPAKWPMVGVPEKYWWFFIERAMSSPFELYWANRVARREDDPVQRLDAVSGEVTAVWGGAWVGTQHDYHLPGVDLPAR